ncbi:DUF3857 and transglutaminase domain-containing protein [candidate division WOR-3 bacterium]|nr:DUF3857 and transglutaminase domain-containing protein [candidate division WOR-3 bacterium]
MFLIMFIICASPPFRLLDSLHVDIHFLQGKDAVVLLEDKDGEYVETGACKFTTRRLIYLGTKKGIRRYGSIRVGYTPMYNRVFFRSLILHKKDGRKIKYSIDKIGDFPVNERVIFWGGREKVFNFTDAEPGDVIEYSYDIYGTQVALLSKEDFKKFTPPMIGEFYYVELFQERIPVWEKIFIIKGPASKPLRYKIYRGQADFYKKRQGKYIIYTWEAKRIKEPPSETQSVPFGEIASKLIVTTIPSWKVISKWMYNITEPVLKRDMTLKNKVRKLTRGAESDKDRMYRVFRFVADSIRYLGTSMGKGEGYTPHPAIMTLKEREGVCKDKAALLVAMLREAGFESYICMTSAMGRVENLPANQFNHAVGCIKTSKGYIFLDPTWSDGSRELFSSLEQDQSILPATPWGETLMITPPYPGKNSMVKVRGNIWLDKSGNVKGKLSFFLSGRNEDMLRRRLKREEGNRDKQGEILRSFSLNAFGANAEIDSFTVQNLKSLFKPLQFAIYFKANDYAAKRGKKLLFPSPALSIIRYNNWWFREFTSVEERKTPMYSVIWISGMDINLRYHLPKSYSIEIYPKKLGVSDEAIDFSYSWDHPVEKLYFTFNDPIITPKEYCTVKKTVDIINKKSKEWFIAGRE